MPPKNCQTPSDNFLKFCDNIVQNSRSDRDTGGITQSGGEDSQVGAFKPNYKRQLEGLRKNFEENLYSPEQRIRPTLDTSYPLHNFILGTKLTRKISPTWRYLWFWWYIISFPKEKSVSVK